MIREFRSVGFFGAASVFWSWKLRQTLSSDQKRVVSFEELQTHNKPDDCWIAINQKVYDVTEFIKTHPGGVARILRYAGNDATKGFHSMHHPQYLETFLDGSLVGEINDLPTKKKKTSTRKKQKLIEIEEQEEQVVKLIPPTLSQIFSLSDFEVVAKNVLSPATLVYVSSGADDEFTLRENRYALGRIFFRPRCLTDISNFSIETDILGVRTAAPFFISSFTGSNLIQPEGEKILARAAAEEKIAYMAPKRGSVSLEQLHAETAHGQVLFYQHEFESAEELREAPKLFKHIEATMPQVKAIFVNVDTAARGHREKEYKVREMEAGKTNANLAGLLGSEPEYVATWQDFETIRKSTNLPIILKGLQRKEDILKAAELGFRGALISNSGGRQLDFSKPAIETLAEVHEALKEKKIERNQFQLFVEGGFSRGSDVIKALCLGAIPAIGRPMLYSEVYGQKGVEKASQLLKEEITRDMKLLGAGNVSCLDDSYLDLSSLTVKLWVPDFQYERNYTPMVNVI
ncbi:hypothetical protein KL925_001819 [Ogataea polymorpha]|uniref:Cytochrome b2, mitochondrial n=1 Tax=Ogataea polymorpha TaxID=460523 RepID=A0A9P8T1E6_9ASCO|nr:hypothetical protein KL936_001818 [Ogataea polymorpha]KAG7895228.1 hypothetical protein KL908_001578 [Ogataea polymorpha]KAG7912443.1 hypothetical protein KL907_000645 [Ogataea polymorpha]KAG7919058.1 hypothetical protein KL927_001187 [Ogataea polymorpha]KAG7928519.1 hypothetical protein KL925_001819 [Ogataea polymorpha]